MGHSPPPSFKHKKPSQGVRPPFSRKERDEPGGKVTVRHFHSDSSTFAWGGLDIKELRAAVDTVLALAKPGDRVN